MRRTSHYTISRCAFALFTCVLVCACPGKQRETNGPDDATAVSKAEPVERGIAFKTSCAAATQAQFDRGLFLLHNMMYVQAREVFTAAEAGDKQCAMLYWGIALTHFQPIWPGEPCEEDLRAGASALERAHSVSASATELERAFVAAADGFYSDWDKRDYRSRLVSWEAAQRQLATRYPDDIEAQVFAALAGIATRDKFDPTHAKELEMAALLDEVLEQRPEHSGALHYTLHAYDNAVTPSRGVKAAQSYDKVAPKAPHALHMPSHIYVRLGDWPQVVQWNIRSAAAAEEQPFAEDVVSRHLLHALDYLVFGYLQRGEDELAAAARARMDAALTYQPNSGPAAYALAASPARFAIERRDWKQASDLPVRRPDYTWDPFPWAEAITHAARGLGAARNGDAKSAKKSVDVLTGLKQREKNEWWQLRIQIQIDVISGWLAHHRGNSDKALATLAAAAKKELDSGKWSVEPGHVISAAEHHALLLLELKRGKEALAAYELALKDTPKRFNVLYGAGLAAELAQLPDRAKDSYTQLVAVASETSKRPALAHVKAYLSN